MQSRVLDLAGRNDPDANRLVDHAAQGLAELVDTAVRRLGLKDPPLGLAGSMIRMAYKKALLQRIKCPLGPVSMAAEPTMCAIVIARRLLTAGRSQSASV